MIFKKLAFCRKVLELTQVQAAEGSGLSQRDISRIEHRKVKSIPHKYLCYLYEQGIDLNWLFDPGGNMEKDFALRNTRTQSVTFEIVDQPMPMGIRYVPCTQAENYINHALWKRKLEELPLLAVPGVSQDWKAFEVPDNYQEQRLRKGDVAICAVLSDHKKISEDRPYVVVGKDKILCGILKVNPAGHANENGKPDLPMNIKVSACPKPGEKKPTEVPLEQVLEIWEIKSLISRVDKI